MTNHSVIDVISIEHFSTKDGNGIRTVVFVQGCPLRCKWCHNPESQSAESIVLYEAKQCICCGACEAVCTGKANFIDESGHRFDRKKCVSCGKCAEVCPTNALKLSSVRMTVDEIISEVKKDTAFYGNNGGLTVSGGEPFLRAPEMVKLLKAAKAEGINTVAETCGCFDGKYLSEIVNVTDLFYWDYKDSDPQRHLLNTGIRNDSILKNLFTADEMGAKTVLRCILINGINFNDRHLQGIADTFFQLKNCVAVHLIAYHAYAGSKALLIGKEDNGRSEWVLSQGQMSEAVNFLKAKGIPAYIQL